MVHFFQPHRRAGFWNCPLQFVFENTLIRGGCQNKKNIHPYNGLMLTFALGFVISITNTFLYTEKTLEFNVSCFENTFFLREDEVQPQTNILHTPFEIRIHSYLLEEVFIITEPTKFANIFICFKNMFQMLEQAATLFWEFLTHDCRDYAKSPAASYGMI